MKQDTYIVVATLVLFMDICPESEGLDYQAEVDLGDSNSEFLQMIFKQIELLRDKRHNKTSELFQEHTQLASALLRVAPVITIKGNISDPTRSLTLTFLVHASQHDRDLSMDLQHNQRDVEKHKDGQWAGRGGGGMLSPIVGLVEPYVLGLAELVVTSILSTAIGNFLEGVTLAGNVQLI